MNYQDLIEYLEKRLAVIGDHDLRERDPDEQLRQLQEVSEAIFAWQKKYIDQLPPRLGHFLDNCSYDKALEWLKTLDK